MLQRRHRDGGHRDSGWPEPDPDLEGLVPLALASFAALAGCAQCPASDEVHIPVHHMRGLATPLRAGNLS